MGHERAGDMVRVLERLSEGLTVRLACAEAGVEPAAFRARCLHDRVFRERVNDAFNQADAHRRASLPTTEERSYAP